MGSFNYEIIQRALQFKKELDLSPNTEKKGIHSFPEMDKEYYTYRLNGSNLVLEHKYFLLPSLVIDGRDEGHINHTLEILTENHPQIKISKGKLH